ncbi:hypothetical protein E4U41_003902 [Claviceps citrina]|nr:hypothetical protein E4U41_003902 [Claviceps citrina]
MAMEEEGPRLVDGRSHADEDARGPDDVTTLKRKASLVGGDGDGDGAKDGDKDASTKRQRQDAREQPAQSPPPPTSESPPRGGESPLRRRRSSHDTSRDGRESVLQEEKKRGKRLFGGLLSTLSQTSTTSQHRRRQEIERRQQERLQKQREQDDEERAARLCKIREARLVEQVDFQEQVMRHRHTKMLDLAEFLKTRAEPAIYYLPWKRTADQQDTIEEQLRVAKSTMAHEEEDFRALKERHAIRYGLRRGSHHQRGEDSTERAEEGEKGMHAQQGDVGRAVEHEAEAEDEAPPGEGHAEVQTVTAAAQHHDAHDESGDVVVDADEDMVIY